MFKQKSNILRKNISILNKIPICSNKNQNIEEEHQYIEKK